MARPVPLLIGEDEVLYDEISDLDHYDAVVFGSGVYNRSWTAEATRTHASTHRGIVLAHKPVWLFSVGSDPTAGSWLRWLDRHRWEQCPPAEHHAELARSSCGTRGCRKCTRIPSGERS